MSGGCRGLSRFARQSANPLTPAVGRHPIRFLNPRKALEYLRRHDDIDLVCTDLNMPEMNGLTFARKCHELRPQLPILLCSGLTVNIDEAEARDAGISRLLDKPVELGALRKALAELAKGKRA